MSNSTAPATEIPPAGHNLHSARPGAAVAR